MSKPERDLLKVLVALIEKLEVLSGCNEHDMHGETPLPEYVAARKLIAKYGR
jgi:hypothetical protein